MEEEIGNVLASVVYGLSDQNYEHSFAFYSLWLDIQQTYSQIPSDKISGTIWNSRRTSSISIQGGQLIHSTAHLITRLASKAESNHLLTPHTSGLQSRLSMRSLQEFFKHNLQFVRGYTNTF